MRRCGTRSMPTFRTVQQGNHCAREDFLYELKATIALVRTFLRTQGRPCGRPPAAAVLAPAATRRDLVPRSPCRVMDLPRACAIRPEEPPTDLAGATKANVSRWTVQAVM